MMLIGQRHEIPFGTVQEEALLAGQVPLSKDQLGAYRMPGEGLCKSNSLPLSQPVLR